MLRMVAEKTLLYQALVVNRYAKNNKEVCLYIVSILWMFMLIRAY